MAGGGGCEGGGVSELQSAAALRGESGEPGPLGHLGSGAAMAAIVRGVAQAWRQSITAVTRMEAAVTAA